MRSDIDPRAFWAYIDICCKVGNQTPESLAKLADLPEDTFRKRKAFGAWVFPPGAVIEQFLRAGEIPMSMLIEQLLLLQEAEKKGIVKFAPETPPGVEVIE